MARATVGQTIRSLPATARVVLRLGWRASPRLLVLTAALHLVAGCATTFGLLSWAHIFTTLLAAGPTPQGSWPRRRRSRWWSWR